MIRAKSLPEVLSQLITETTTTVILANNDGALLGIATAEDVEETLNPQLFGAIASNLWKNFEESVKYADRMEFQFVHVEKGYIGITRAGPSSLLASFSSSDCFLGEIKSKLLALGAYIGKEFEQLQECP